MDVDLTEFRGRNVFLMLSIEGINPDPSVEGVLIDPKISYLFKQ